jgi:hypothetical protein
MPKLREKAPEKVSFTIRYEAAHLAAIDAMAERGGITRAEATRDVMAAGLDALQAKGPTLADVMRRLDAVGVPPQSSAPSPVLDTEALADALADRLAGRLAATQTGLPVDSVKAALAGLRAGRARGAAAGANRDKAEEAAVLDGVVLAAIDDLARLLGEDADERDAAVPAGRIVGGPPRGRERRKGAPDPRGEDAPGRRLADVLRDAIADRRMTLRETADATGLSLSTVCRALRGESLRGESLISLQRWAEIEGP